MRFLFINLPGLFVIGIFLCTSPRCAAQATPSPALLALSKANHTLTIVDPATLKPVARIPVGQDAHEVVASADGKTAYVSIYGGGRFHVLNRIDLVAQKPLDSIDTGPLLGPHGLAVAGGKLWFTAEGARAVGRFAPQAAKIDWIMGTGQDRTHMIYVTQDGNQVYTTNAEAGTVSILANVQQSSSALGAQPQAEWRQTVVPVGKGAEGFDVSPDGRELWTANAQDGTLSVVDLATRKVITTIDASIPGSNRLKFTPDGKRVLISSLRIGDLFIYDAALRKEVKRLTVGHGAAGILVSPDGSRAFVACTPDNYVAVINLRTLAVTSRIDAGAQPDGLAWAVRQQ